MKPAPPLDLPAKLSIAALFVLGLLGGALVVAHSGYETSPRHGGTPVFVPVPQAYVVAAALYGASCLAMLALIRDRTKSPLWSAAAVAGYPAAAWVVVQVVGRM